MYRTAITSLSLHHFRNYASLALAPDALPVVLTGHNGAGKTNILEAISLLSPGRGLRKAELVELQHAGAASWVVSAEVLRGEESVRIGTARETADGVDRRIIKIDGKATKGHAELADKLNILWLTPQMDTVFQEGGTARRKLMDRLTFHFDSAHATRVNAYEQTMRERNRLLAEGRRDPHWLDALEVKLAELGTAIGIARMQAAERINAAMQEHKGLFPTGHIRLHGEVEDGLARGDAALVIEHRLSELLAKNRGEDAAAGRTLIGVHRSTVEVEFVEKSMSVERGSTGEQKAMLLAIVMAEARAVSQWRGATPIVLLDEVVAHLDEGRRAALYDTIRALGIQAWLTGTDASLFSALLPHAQHVQVESGVATPTHQ